MDSCCDNKESELRGLAIRQKGTLKWVLFINLTMFFLEATYGFWARSSALLADSLDMLGDSLVYTASLYAVDRGARWSAKVSFFKGTLMTLLGLGVLFQAIIRFMSPELPIAETMGWVGGLALIANVTCLYMLLRHRNDDINMRSTWLCSRNDVIANVGVLIAAGAVVLTESKYPDILVGVAIAFLVLRSAKSVLSESWNILRA